jgi:hypothetical protein
MSAPVMGGIEIALEDTLVGYIQEWTKDDFFKIKRTSTDPSYSDPAGSEIQMGPAIVHAGMLPKNEVGQILVDTLPLYPCVICHVSNIDDMMPESCIYTKVIVGVWDNNADYQGYRDALILIRKIIRKVWYWNTLADSYQINMSRGVQSRIYDTNESTWPFFFAEATLAWRMRTPFMRAESDDLDYFPNPDILQGASPYPTTIETT